MDWLDVFWCSPFFLFLFSFFLVVVEGGESGCNRVYSQLLPLIIFHLFILSSRMDERKAKRGSGGGSWMADWRGFVRVILSDGGLAAVSVWAAT